MQLTQQLMNVMTAPPQYREVGSQPYGVAVNTLPDGTVVSLNVDGQIVQALYATGAKVRRNERTCLVQTSEGSYWLGDSDGRWYALD